MAGLILDQKADGAVERLHKRGHRMVVTSEQPVDAIVAMNAAARNVDCLQGFRFAPVCRKVASIPVELVAHLLHQGLDILCDQAAMRRVLNDPANRAFRTTGERV